MNFLGRACAYIAMVAGNAVVMTSAAVEAIRRVSGDYAPQVAIVLGSGLAGAPDYAQFLHMRDFADVPGFAAPTVPGHGGSIAIADWSGRRTLIFLGRLHRYEGFGWDAVTLPVRIAAAMGTRVCVFTNASGAINRSFEPGMLVVITDHINAFGSGPLIGPSIGEISRRFVDMSDAYSPALVRQIDESARKLGIRLGRGVYAGVTGPNYETPAEIRALASLGADLVGMSTVGEVIAARSLGLECCAISCVANMAAGITATAIRHDDVLASGQSAADQLGRLLTEFLSRLPA